MHVSSKAALSCEDKSDIVFFGGGIGCGKSRNCLNIVMLTALAKPNTVILYVPQPYPGKTAIVKVRDDIKQSGWSALIDGDSQELSSIFVLNSGSTIVIAPHSNAIASLQGLTNTVDLVVIDEIGHDEDYFNAIIDHIRQSKSGTKLFFTATAKTGSHLAKYSDSLGYEQVTFVEDLRISYFGSSVKDNPYLYSTEYTRMVDNLASDKSNPDSNLASGEWYSQKEIKCL